MEGANSVTGLPRMKSRTALSSSLYVASLVLYKVVRERKKEA